MGYRWPADTVFTQHILTVEQEYALCQRRLQICDHRLRRLHTLQGPVALVCKLAHAPAPHCPAAHRTLSPLAEAQLTLPHGTIGWECLLLARPPPLRPPRVPPPVAPGTA